MLRLKNCEWVGRKDKKKREKKERTYISIKNINKGSFSFGRFPAVSFRLSVCVSVCLSVCLCVCLPVCRPFVSLSPGFCCSDSFLLYLLFLSRSAFSLYTSFFAVLTVSRALGKSRATDAFFTLLFLSFRWGHRSHRRSKLSASSSRSVRSPQNIVPSNQCSTKEAEIDNNLNDLIISF